MLQFMLEHNDTKKPADKLNRDLMLKLTPSVAKAGYRELSL